MCHLYCYLVGLIWIWWWKDLPKLSTVSLGTATFMCVHSVVFESNWNGWIDDSDLPKLQSIQLGRWALQGDGRDDRKTINNSPFNYKNTLTLRSKNEWNDEWRDLPSLTQFKGDGLNFEFIGSVILESIDLVCDWCRYPQVAVWCDSIPR